MRFLILFLMSFVFTFALEKSNIEKTMQENINKSLVLLQQSSKDKRKAAAGIFELFDPIFDYKLMAKLSLSKRYNTLSKAQQDEFDKAFEKQLKASFTNKLSLYTDEKIVVEGMKQENEKRIFLSSYMIIDGEKKHIIFKFYDNNANWLIYDVDVLGVSLIQTYRSQFADLFDKEGFEILLEKMQKQEFEDSMTQKSK